MINNFIEFLSANEKTPEEQLKKARNEFPFILAKNGFSIFDKNNFFLNSKTDEILIGVALYSADDLNLLDAIINKLRNSQELKKRIRVFDVLECENMSDFDKYIKGIGNVYQSPVLGIWEKGKLIRKSWGFEAREEIADLFGLSF